MTIVASASFIANCWFFLTSDPNGEVASQQKQVGQNRVPQVVVGFRRFDRCAFVVFSTRVNACVEVLWAVRM